LKFSTLCSLPSSRILNIGISGQLSVQRAILCVQEYKGKWKESVAAFCEEAIVRRELADNFCFYNEKYDQVAGTNEWAIKTLNDHKKDKREYIYR